MTPEERDIENRNLLIGLMQGALSSQAAQIEALKEKLVESEARRLYPFTVPMWDNLPDEDFAKRTFGGVEERHGKAFYRHEAHRQLEAEMPEVEW